jgi:AMP nucleosidase
MASRSALAQVRAIYSQQIDHLRDAMHRFVAGESLPGHVRACSFVRIHTDTVVRQRRWKTWGSVMASWPARAVSRPL